MKKFGLFFLGLTLILQALTLNAHALDVEIVKEETKGADVYLHASVHSTYNYLAIFHLRLDHSTDRLQYKADHIEFFVKAPNKDQENQVRSKILVESNKVIEEVAKLWDAPIITSQFHNYVNPLDGMMVRIGTDIHFTFWGKASDESIIDAARERE
ncbi:MAG: hypothetical protein KDD46_00255 [Bdellovibrionales bacterium]|nr:hypothetical protein [Bdellovibrionales bacterium]